MNKENKIKTKEETRDHLIRILREIRKLMNEVMEEPGDFGDFENRLYWAIKGIDVHKAICRKHNRKLTKNEYGEFICSACIDDIIEKSSYDEDLWFDLDNEPSVKIRGIKYGLN